MMKRKKVYDMILFLVMVSRPVFGLQRQPLNITAVTGITVELKCKVKLHECGNFNGIEWYREPLSIHHEDNSGDLIELRQRVYVYRHHSGISKPEGHWVNRARHIYDTKKHIMRVKLSPLMLEDEAAYSCEITYEEPGRWFKDSCQDPQLTLLNVLGKPDDVIVTMENGTELEDGYILGPYTEGSNLLLRCHAEGGRPIPEVVWHDGEREIPNSWHWRVEHDNGTGSVQSEINIELSRLNLGLPLICKVNSSALDAPISKKIHINMEVAPNLLIMERPHDREAKQADVPEGGRLSVTCIASGAKPQAYIYWNSEPKLNNTTEDIHEEVTRESNGLTFQTLQRLTFPAQKELTSLSCFAANAALDERDGQHLKQTTTINVKYKPEIQNNRTQVIHAIEDEPFNVSCKFKANPLEGAHIKWYRNGHIIETLHNPPKGMALTLKASKSTAGLYACQVENEVGRSSQVDLVQIVVEEKPQVTLYFEPRHPVSEVADANVTLMCSSNNLIHGRHFKSVKWYLDGDLLKQVDKSPECLVPNITKSHCHVDPSKVMLLNVKRSFRGNYSCQAQNRAGWGPISEAKEMKVLYPPEGTIISVLPKIITKNKPFEINCAVKDKGFPKSDMVRWLHNGHEIKGQTSFSLQKSHADVFSSGNYSCVPFNQVGMAQPAKAYIRVFSPPNFVQSLPQVSGIPYQQKSVHLKCVVECFPLCEIIWHKNNTPIPISNKRSLGGGVYRGSGQLDMYSRFSVKTEHKKANSIDNVLEHVQSVLTLDFNDWPGDQLTTSDKTSYSCVSSANSMGPSVQSSTNFRVHYPPKNIRVNPRTQNVFEKDLVDPFTCYAEAFPKARYYWNFEEGNFTAIGPTLTFRHGIRRYQAGIYTCTAYNDLNSLKMSISLNVYYKPNCRIRNEETIDGGLNLRCDVDAFPPNVTYTWTHNDQPIPASDGPTLYYRHANSLLKKAKEGDEEAVAAIFGTFACQASNIAGLGEKCSISIDGPPSALVADTDTTYLIFGGAAVFLVLCIIIVSILLCRKWSVAKYDAAINRVPEMSRPGSVPLSAGPISGPPSSANTDLSLKKATLHQNQQQPISNSNLEIQKIHNTNGGFINGISNRAEIITDPRISEPVYSTSTNTNQQHQQNFRENDFTKNNVPIINTKDNNRSVVNYELWEMDNTNTTTPIGMGIVNGGNQPPPPPMYRRVQAHAPPTHMMTLDRRIPGGGGGIQHHLVPNGCDLTLNRRHFNNSDHRVRTRRHADELWLV